MSQILNIKETKQIKKTFTAYALNLMFVTGTIHAYGKENASNPLAAVSNTDLRYQFFDLDGSDRSDFWVDGPYMLTPKLKLKYELHYWDTDVTGSSESGFETFHLKPIYFPKQGEWGSWNYKLVVGAEWIVGFGNEDKGIGSGSDQIAPLVGLALVRGATRKNVYAIIWCLRGRSSRHRWRQTL